jgi:hypothetical protein
MAILDLDNMNQLNETLRILRIQIQAEEMKPKPDLLTLKRLRKEEKKCLKQLMD